jgi:hypothetical protein
MSRILSTYCLASSSTRTLRSRTPWAGTSRRDLADVAVVRIVHVDQGAQAGAGLELLLARSSAAAVASSGRGSDSQRLLSRSMAMMSACLVIAQNGR